MSITKFKEGDKVRLSLDGRDYIVDTISPEQSNVPGEKTYFIRPVGLWPWQVFRTHNIPERAAKKYLTIRL